MENIFGEIVNTFFVIIFAVIAVGILAKCIKNNCAREKSVAAAVTDKQTVVAGGLANKYPQYAKKRYIITFAATDGKRTFEVSADTFAGCHVNEAGILTYKGMRFLSFEGTDGGVNHIAQEPSEGI